MQLGKLKCGLFCMASCFRFGFGNSILTCTIQFGFARPWYTYNVWFRVSLEAEDEEIKILCEKTARSEAFWASKIVPRKNKIMFLFLSVKTVFLITSVENHTQFTGLWCFLRSFYNVAAQNFLKNIFKSFGKISLNNNFHSVFYYLFMTLPPVVSKKFVPAFFCARISLPAPNTYLFSRKP